LIHMHAKYEIIAPDKAALPEEFMAIK
jgi:hypothetical protein